MDDQRKAEAYRHAPAVLLDTGRTNMLTACEQALQEMGSRLLSDQNALLQFKTHIGQIVDDAAVSVRADCANRYENRDLLAFDIGVTRAAKCVHPGKSLLAASALLETVVALIELRLEDPSRSLDEALPGYLRSIPADDVTVQVRVTVPTRPGIGTRVELLAPLPGHPHELN